jgi:hypothetical protein
VPSSHTSGDRQVDLVLASLHSHVKPGRVGPKLSQVFEALSVREVSSADRKLRREGFWDTACFVFRITFPTKGESLRTAVSELVVASTTEAVNAKIIASRILRGL